MPYLEDDFALVLPLDGEWQFRLGAGGWTTIPVPSAWEVHTADKVTDGPALYRRIFHLPDHWLRHRLVLDAHAVSFDAAVRVNGQLVGHHRGMWSPFQLEVTPFVRAGENELEIEVWKPGGRFPVRETLAGFLPDVCTAFGGLWQSIELKAYPHAALHDLRVNVHDSVLHVSGGVTLFDDDPRIEIRLELRDAEGDRLSHAAAQVDVARGTFSAALPAPPGSPEWEPKIGAALLQLTLAVRRGEQLLAHATRRIGLRDVHAQGRNTFLNARPLHLRGVLDWGWDAQRLCPTPSIEELRRNFANARALGFNLFKLCLFVPDEMYFDTADEEGILLWLEMPMWLPRVRPEFKELALREYREVFRRVHHHPSLALLSLGCELNSAADADFLRDLHALAREWFPNALICDNSGSAEAYGGVQIPLSDFYDYHFYTDPHFFQPLVEHFRRAYQPEKPWLYGEFCDADTLRNFSQMQPEPWWLTDKVALERDDYIYQREYKQRLSVAGISDGGVELTRIARLQATAIRKFILELVRRENATGGYVVFNWMDTPITTSGIVDDQHQLKFSPDEWRSFNADAVLTIDRERRRRLWAGGDRPHPKDPFTWWQGERAEIHIVFSNGLRDFERGQLAWELVDSNNSVIARGTQDIVSLPSAEVREIAVITPTMPSGPRPIELKLTATLRVSAEHVIQNSWTLWTVPKPPPIPGPSPRWGEGSATPLSPKGRGAGGESQPVVTNTLNDSLLTAFRSGQHALLWLTHPDERFTRALPFWREAIHVFQPHPLWERVPHAGYADMRFFSLATDFALHLPSLANVLGNDVTITPIWRRFDARQMTWADYVVEVETPRQGVSSGGHLFITTLRLEGGLGGQPVSFETNPWGAWMFASLWQYLQETRA